MQIVSRAGRGARGGEWQSLQFKAILASFGLGFASIFRFTSTVSAHVSHPLILSSLQTLPAVSSAPPEATHPLDRPGALSSSDAATADSRAQHTADSVQRKVTAVVDRYLQSAGGISRAAAFGSEQSPYDTTEPAPVTPVSAVAAQLAEDHAQAARLAAAGPAQRSEGDGDPSKRSARNARIPELAPALQELLAAAVELPSPTSAKQAEAAKLPKSPVFEHPAPSLVELSAPNMDASLAMLARLERVISGSKSLQPADVPPSAAITAPPPTASAREPSSALSTPSRIPRYVGHRASTSSTPARAVPMPPARTAQSVRSLPPLPPSLPQPAGPASVVSESAAPTTAPEALLENSIAESAHSPPLLDAEADSMSATQLAETTEAAIESARHARREARAMRSRARAALAVADELLAHEGEMVSPGTAARLAVPTILPSGVDELYDDDGDVPRSVSDSMVPEALAAPPRSSPTTASQLRESSAAVADKRQKNLMDAILGGGAEVSSPVSVRADEPAPAAAAEPAGEAHADLSKLSSAERRYLAWKEQQQHSTSAAPSSPGAAAKSQVSPRKGPAPPPPALLQHAIEEASKAAAIAAQRGTAIAAALAAAESGIAPAKADAQEPIPVPEPVSPGPSQSMAVDRLIASLRINQPPPSLASIRSQRPLGPSHFNAFVSSAISPSSAINEPMIPSLAASRLDASSWPMSTPQQQPTALRPDISVPASAAFQRALALVDDVLTTVERAGVRIAQDWASENIQVPQAAHMPTFNASTFSLAPSAEAIPAASPQRAFRRTGPLHVPSPVLAVRGPVPDPETEIGTEVTDEQHQPSVVDAAHVEPSQQQLEEPVGEEAAAVVDAPREPVGPTLGSMEAAPPPQIPASSMAMHPQKPAKHSRGRSPRMDEAAHSTSATASAPPTAAQNVVDAGVAADTATPSNNAPLDNGTIAAAAEVPRIGPMSSAIGSILSPMRNLRP